MNDRGSIGEDLDSRLKPFGALGFGAPGQCGVGIWCRMVDRPGDLARTWKAGGWRSLEAYFDNVLGPNPPRTFWTPVQDVRLWG